MEEKLRSDALLVGVTSMTPYCDSVTHSVKASKARLMEERLRSDALLGCVTSVNAGP